MCEPTAQNYSSDARYDDVGIGDADRLLRHCRSPVQVVPCPVNGRRISSQAFKAAKGEKHVSIDLECLLAQDGLPPDARYGLMPSTHALAAITAAQARALGQGVAWTPKPADTAAVGAAGLANPYHGEVLGPLTKRALVELSEDLVLVRNELAA